MSVWTPTTLMEFRAALYAQLEEASTAGRHRGGRSVPRAWGGMAAELAHTLGRMSGKPRLALHAFEGDNVHADRELRSWRRGTTPMPAPRFRAGVQHLLAAKVGGGELLAHMRGIGDFFTSAHQDLTWIRSKLTTLRQAPTGQVAVWHWRTPHYKPKFSLESGSLWPPIGALGPIESHLPFGLTMNHEHLSDTAEAVRVQWGENNLLVRCWLVLDDDAPFYEPVATGVRIVFTRYPFPGHGSMVSVSDDLLLSPDEARQRRNDCGLQLAVTHLGFDWVIVLTDGADTTPAVCGVIATLDGQRHQAFSTLEDAAHELRDLAGATDIDLPDRTPRCFPVSLSNRPCTDCIGLLPAS